MENKITNFTHEPLIHHRRIKFTHTHSWGTDIKLIRPLFIWLSIENSNMCHLINYKWWQSNRQVFMWFFSHKNKLDEIKIKEYETKWKKN